MLLINRFIGLIEDHAESLSLRWVDEVRTNPLTSGYAKLSKNELHDIVFTRFRRLGKWIEKREGLEKDIAENFCKIGRSRAQSGIVSSEVVYSLILEKDILWHYIQNEGIINEGIDMNRALQFINRLNYFYDKAIYFCLVGYENAHLDDEKVKQEGVFEKTFEGFKHWIIRE